MYSKRTDLAVESAELFRAAQKKGARLPGVLSGITRQNGFEVTTVRILDQQGEKALGKPAGAYVTVDLRPYFQRTEGAFSRAVECLSAQLRGLLPEDLAEKSVLVVGLGNRDMTPDAIGPLTVSHLLVTRHMIASLPEQFQGFASVSAFCTGVLGSTGMETLELIRGIVRQIGPAAVIAVDALAARKTERICTTVQLSDTGLIPGSGVGNHRKAVNQETLGIPVISVGVPTVIDAATLAADILEEAGNADFDLSHHGSGLFVTPKEIDTRVEELAKIVGYGIDLALQPALDLETLTGLVG